MKFYYWTVRLGVASHWVEDGFDLDNDRAHDMLAHHLSHANGHELKAEVLHAPPADEVAKEQGYKSAAEANIHEVDYSARRRAIAARADALASAFLDEATGARLTNNVIKQTLTNKLRSMVELVLCEEMGVPWAAPLRKKPTKKAG